MLHEEIVLVRNWHSKEKCKSIFNMKTQDSGTGNLDKHHITHWALVGVVGLLWRMFPQVVTFVFSKSI